MSGQIRNASVAAVRLLMYFHRRSEDAFFIRPADLFKHNFTYRELVARKR